MYKEVIASKYTTRDTQVRAMYRLGMCQQETKNTYEARSTYRKLLKQDGVPDDLRAKTMISLALCYWNAGLKDAAQRLMGEVVSKYPDTEEAMSARGTLYLWSKE